MPPAAAAQQAAILTPTVEMPLMTGIRAEMLQTMDSRRSLYSLSLHFGSIIKELESLAREPSRTIVEFKIDSSANKWRMIHILHAIPRVLLRSIICGTVAYDAHKGRVEYSRGGPGIYVIGIYINRDTSKTPAGSFLTWREMAVLIRHLENYIEAYEIIKSKRVRSQDDRGKVRVASNIDKAYQKSLPYGATEKTLFIDSDVQAENVRALVRGLKERKPATTQDRDTAQHQSPLYVGCSDNVEARLASYNLQKGVSGINKLLALTVSVIKFMGLIPMLIRRVALRTWEPKQLAPAEKLVIALARSSCHMDRFNVAEGGGKVSADRLAVLERGKEEVMREGHYRRNLKASLEDMTERIAFVENQTEIRDSIPEMQRIIKNMEKDEDQRSRLLNLDVAHAERVQQELDEELDRITKRNELLERMLKLSTLVRDAAKGDVEE